MQSKSENTVRENSDPLVSIVLMTFNSASTVRETLESLLHQQYGELEVILCDDGSKDGTVKIMEEWRDLHSSDFRRIEILASDENRGICRNITVGYAAAAGEWIKPIAGDDIVLPGAIRRYVEFSKTVEASVIFAPVRTFSTSQPFSTGGGKVLPSEDSVALIAGDQAQLLKKLRVRNMILAPGVFFKRADYLEIGGIDLRFVHLDDWPLWINFLEKGKTFAWLPEVLVAYRLGDTISVSKNATGINRDFLLDHVTFYENYQIGYINNWHRWDRILEVFRFKLAKGVLRPYPRFYKLTGVLRFLSPLYFFRRS